MYLPDREGDHGHGTVPRTRLYLLHSEWADPCDSPKCGKPEV